VGSRKQKKATGLTTVAFLNLAVLVQRARLLASAELTETLVEALDTAAGIHHLLSASVEWVTLGTYFNAQRLAQRRASFDFVTTAAGNFDFFVLWMDILLHLSFLELRSAAT